MPLIVNLRVCLQLNAQNISVVIISKYLTNTRRSNVQLLVDTKLYNLYIISSTNNYVKIFYAERYS